MKILKIDVKLFLHGSVKQKVELFCEANSRFSFIKIINNCSTSVMNFFNNSIQLGIKKTHYAYSGKHSRRFKSELCFFQKFSYKYTLYEIFVLKQ